MDKNRSETKNSFSTGRRSIVELSRYQDRFDSFSDSLNSNNNFGTCTSFDNDQRPLEMWKQFSNLNLQLVYDREEKDDALTSPHMNGNILFTFNDFSLLRSINDLDDNKCYFNNWRFKRTHGSSSSISLHICYYSAVDEVICVLVIIYTRRGGCYAYYTSAEQRSKFFLVVSDIQLCVIYYGSVSSNRYYLNYNIIEKVVYPPNILEVAFERSFKRKTVDTYLEHRVMMSIIKGKVGVFEVFTDHICKRLKQRINDVIKPRDRISGVLIAIMDHLSVSDVAGDSVIIDERSDLGLMSTVCGFSLIDDNIIIEDFYLTMEYWDND